MTLQEIINQDITFRYKLLYRLRQDCAYYLGFGNRQKKHLLMGDEKQQIDAMNALYNSFPSDRKPEWMTMADIERFAAEMMDPK